MKKCSADQRFMVEITLIVLIAFSYDRRRQYLTLFRLLIAPAGI